MEITVDREQCAVQEHTPQGLKPTSFLAAFGTTEVVPFRIYADADVLQQTLNLLFFTARFLPGAPRSYRPGFEVRVVLVIP